MSLNNCAAVLFAALWLTNVPPAMAQLPPRGSLMPTPVPMPAPGLREQGRRLMLCPAYTGAGTTHSGSANNAEFWSAAGSPHLIPNDFSIYAQVTVEACAVVRIAAGKTLTLKPNGALIVAGQESRPVTLERRDAAPWATIAIQGGTLSLTNAIVRGGGASTAAVSAISAAINPQSGVLHVDNVEIADSQSQGIYLNGSTGFDATSQNLRIHGSPGYPLHTYAKWVGSIPSGSYTGNGNDAIQISGSGGPVSTSQTMHNRGVPYHVGGGAAGGRLDIDSLQSGTIAVLTIEPGVMLQFPPGGLLYVKSLGALIAYSTGAPILFASDLGPTATAGSWRGIWFGAPLDPRNLLQNVKVLHAGGPDSTGSDSCAYPGYSNVNNAAIRIFGPPTGAFNFTGTPTSQFIVNSEIIASARHGIDRGWRSNTPQDFLWSNTFTGMKSAPEACRQTYPNSIQGLCPAPTSANPNPVPCP